MQPGDLVAERYEIEALAGSGGMGTVYRAYDRATGGRVALKLVRRDRDTAGAERFAREAALLAELSHPAIVRHVGHGTTADGRMYLAMDWLEGEPLDERLARRPLSLDQALAVARRIAEGLASAHARGVVHRDVKPSNVLLVEGDPARAVLLDFGIARAAGAGPGAMATTGLTRTGAMIGTVGYMAPEQASGARDLDPRADLFALGCVLFECVTGRAAFAGEHAVAVLAKVLCEPTPDARALRPELPIALDALLARLLAKDRAQRPADAAEVCAALDAVRADAAARGGDPNTAPRDAAAPERTALTAGEHWIVSVLLAEFAAAVTRPDDDDGEDTAPAPPMTSADRAAIVAAVAARNRGALHRLGTGALLVAWTGQGDATEQAVTAALCALDLRRACPDARVALATDRAETYGPTPIGPAIDRAARLLRGSRSPSPASPPPSPSPASAEGAGVRVDGATAGLLAGRFELRAEPSAPGRSIPPDAPHSLLGRRRVPGVRTLLGRATPCVGRDKELALLEATLEECANDRVARAVVITAAPGAGKSRLALEFTARLAAREDLAPPPRVYTAYADPIAAGSALGLVRQLVRAAAQVHEGEPAATQHARLREYVAAIADAAAPAPGSAPRSEGDPLFSDGAIEPAVLAEFLGELVGAPAPADAPASAPLRAARSDPRVMGEWTRRSFVAWARAEAARAPLVLVLEDLHWGDAASVTYVGAALRELAEEQPLLVLALARPEVAALFPGLWAESEPQRLGLGTLTRRASERLARAALGSGVGGSDPGARDGAPERAAVPDALVARLVERAAGNPFYLEELIARVAEGGAGEDAPLPESVLAMVQSRLARLEAPARRVLRAASVFGEVCWQRGVAALLGDANDAAADTAGWLRVLVDREVLEPGRGERFPGEPSYAFRHALLREAAYASLTPDDRARGHLAAGAWLEQAGERDARVLAEHFERGGMPARAAPWLARAAQAALDAGDLRGADALAARALASGAGATDAERGALRMLQALATGRLEDWPASIEHATAAVALLPVGSADWFTAAGGVVFCNSEIGQIGETPAVIAAMLALPDDTPVSGPRMYGLFMLVCGLLVFGQRELAAQAIARADASGARRPASELDAVAAGWHAMAHAWAALYSATDFAATLARTGEAIARFGEAGDSLGLSIATGLRGVTLLESGEFDAAQVLLARAVELAGPVRAASGINALWLARAALYAGRLEEAAARAAPLLEPPEPIVARVARAQLAAARLAQGRREEAARDAALPTMSTEVVAQLVSFRLALDAGRREEALAYADAAVGLEQTGAQLPSDVSGARLARAEALWALGRRDEARAAVREACARIDAIAATLRDPAARERYRSAIAPNARTFALAREWG